MKRTKKASAGGAVAAVFALSMILLTGSAVSGASAALTIRNENYKAELATSTIGVALLENGTQVAENTYDADTNSWKGETGELLTNMTAEGEEITVGKAYEEALTVQNTGEIAVYVRVKITKSWMNADGTKQNVLTPDQIGLNTLSGNWVLDPDSKTAEQEIWYYTAPIASGVTTEALTDTLTVDREIQKYRTSTDNGDGTISTVYDYDGVYFSVKAQVDAVQTHNAEDAIRSAWGVDPEAIGIDTATELD